MLPDVEEARRPAPPPPPRSSARIVPSPSARRTAHRRQVHPPPPPLRDKLTEAGEHVILITPSAHGGGRRRPRSSPSSPPAADASPGAEEPARRRPRPRPPLGRPARPAPDRGRGAAQPHPAGRRARPLGARGPQRPPTTRPLAAAPTTPGSSSPTESPGARSSLPGEKLSKPYDGDVRAADPAGRPQQRVSRDKSRWNGLGRTAGKLAEGARTDQRTYSPFELRLLVGIACRTGVERALASAGESRRRRSRPAHWPASPSSARRLAGLRQVTGEARLVRVPFGRPVARPARRGRISRPMRPTSSTAASSSGQARGSSSTRTSRRGRHIHSQKGRWIDDDDLQRGPRDPRGVPRDALSRGRRCSAPGAPACGDGARGGVPPRPGGGRRSAGAVAPARVRRGARRARADPEPAVAPVRGRGRRVPAGPRAGARPRLRPPLPGLQPRRSGAAPAGGRVPLPDGHRARSRQHLVARAARRLLHHPRPGARGLRARYGAARSINSSPSRTRSIRGSTSTSTAGSRACSCTRRASAFAREVLEGHPAEAAARTSPGCPSCSRRLTALEEVEKRGAVFPAHLPPDTWWSGPHLFPAQGARQGGGSPAWWPARVADIDHEDRIVRLWTGIPV